MLFKAVWLEGVHLHTKALELRLELSVTVNHQRVCGVRGEKEL
jgi:hypothetical protein